MLSGSKLDTEALLGAPSATLYAGACERCGVTVGQSPEDRLRELAHKFTPQVASYLSRRAYPLSNADIEELVEEVLVVVWRRLDDVPEGAELAWMIGVARNVLNNARRKHSRRKAAHDRLVPRGDAPSAEDRVVANEALSSALRSLSDGDREMLLLHYWDGLDVSQLAVALAISREAAATRLSRATSRLRARFEEIPDTDVSRSLEETRDE